MYHIVVRDSFFFGLLFLRYRLTSLMYFVEGELSDTDEEEDETIYDQVFFFDLFEVLLPFLPLFLSFSFSFSFSFIFCMNNLFTPLFENRIFIYNPFPTNAHS